MAGHIKTRGIEQARMATVGNKQLNFNLKKPQTTDYVLYVRSMHTLWLKLCERTALSVLYTFPRREG